MEHEEKMSGDVRITSPLFKKIENFLYHYKWHTVIALVLTVAITICSVQMCTKESYDVYIMYAGNQEIKQRSEGGGISDYQTAKTVLEGLIPDLNEDGEVTVALLPYLLLTSAEIEKIESASEYEVNYNVVRENTENFRQNVVYSDYYLCILSEAVYRQFRKIDGVDIFAELAPYVPEDSSLQYLDERAIRLESTVLGDDPVFRDLSGAVICLRARSEFASNVDRKSRANYAAAEEALRAILRG